jgi:predicted alpha/beta hydrolase family esterase
MPNQPLFVQGGGEAVHGEWDNQLVESLERGLGPDYEIRYPRMPNEADPQYTNWRAALKKELAKLDEGAILVGHSIGGTMLVAALADEPPIQAPRGVFLVSAPFVGKGGWPSGDIQPMSDLGARLPEHVPIYLYHGSEDETAPFAHVGLYEAAIPQAVVRRLAGRDHQLNNDMSKVAADISGLMDQEVGPGA